MKKKKLEVYQLNNVAKVFVGNLVWEYYEIIHNLQTLKIKRLKIEINYKTLVYFFDRSENYIWIGFTRYECVLYFDTTLISRGKFYFPLVYRSTAVNIFFLLNSSVIRVKIEVWPVALPRALCCPDHSK